MTVDDEARARAIRRLVDRTRRDQGLPPHVEDPVVLDRIATLLHGPRR